MSQIPHVALLIETTRSYGRELLQGINRYIAECGPWSVFLELRALDSRAPSWLKHWQGDGILSRTGSQATAEALKQTGLPVVELRATRLQHAFPFVGVDNQALGKLVADHLLERGFRHFGVFRIETEEYFAERCEKFVLSIHQAGYEVSLFSPTDDREQPREWERQQQALACWLTGLPKPCGVLACTDQLGFWLLDACRRAGIAVPEEIAIVGVENEETLCSMSQPPLSSVQFNARKIGYEAAALLDRMMRGESPPSPVLLIEPLGIVTRQSSDVVALEDVELAAAVTYIRQHAREGLSVKQLLAAVPISRSSLERKMRRTLGRSPRAEILRVQLDHVQRLLVETDLSIAAIATAAGFPYPQHLASLFKRRFGRSPSTYREEIRK